MFPSIKKISSVTLSILLVLSVILCTIPINASAATGNVIYNTGSRNETCTSLGSQAEAYYTGDYAWEIMSELTGGSADCVTTQDCLLYQTLHDLMDETMTKPITYSNLKGSGFDYADTTADTTSSYSLFYSSKLNTDYDNSKISREHVWPKSHASFYKKNGGCDLHHLRPEYNDINTARGNYILGNVNGVYEKITTSQLDGKIIFYKYGDDRNKDGRCEVPDEVKGDVARILLYVWCRWEQPNLFQDIADPAVDSNDNANKNKNDGWRVIESLDTLLQWCYDDPVDTWEMERNNATEKIQGNRNVFIDYPEYAWLLFGQEVPEDMVTPSGMAANMGDTSNNGNDGNDGNNDNTDTTCEHSHTELKNVISATCTVNGYSGDLYCSDCQQLLEEGGAIAATGHNWGDWTVSKKPTSSATGIQSRTCANCGGGQTKSLPKQDSTTVIVAVSVGVAVVAIGGGCASFVILRKKRSAAK